MSFDLGNARKLDLTTSKKGGRKGTKNNQNQRNRFIGIRGECCWGGGEN